MFVWLLRPLATSHSKVGSLQVGSFRSPPKRLLQAVYPYRLMGGSIMGDCPPTNYAPALRASKFRQPTLYPEAPSNRPRMA